MVFRDASSKHASDLYGPMGPTERLAPRIDRSHHLLLQLRLRSGRRTEIDCNPRLVEPMAAYLAGTDLVGLLLKVSQGETPDALPESREGTRTHLAMQTLLGCASRGGTRRDIFRECWQLATGGGRYADSTEEMTPVRFDWLSVVPVAMIAIVLLVDPKRAAALARGGWGAHLLDIASIRQIESEEFC
jgi:hypothetical protein